MSEDSCPTCGKWTSSGLYALAERYRDKPIFGTNLKQPISAIFQETRDLVHRARGVMNDLKHGFSGYAQVSEEVAGALTVLMVFLYHQVEECKKIEIEEERKKNA